MPHMRSNKPIYQFVVTLKHTEPAIYRRIEVPKTYTFWDLHVAIQDAFGWQDCHLHEFCFEDRKGNLKGTYRIGIPIDDGCIELEDIPQAGWKIKIEELFCDLGDKMLYIYDFGDHWAHSVVLEGMILGEKKIKYPRCTQGAYLAPPEDCGGIHGFYHMLDVLKNPKDPEYKEMLQWVKAITGKKSYIPDSFDPQSIKFTNPQKRLRQMLEDEE